MSSTYSRVPLRMRLSMLHNVRKLVTRGWVVGRLATSASLSQVMPTSPEARSWCISGAILKTAHDYGRYIARRKDVPEFNKFCETFTDPRIRVEYMERWMFYYLTRLLNGPIPEWNDRVGRTHHQVLSMLDRAIENLRPTKYLAVEELEF
jgi:hypothetical protein